MAMKMQETGMRADGPAVCLGRSVFAPRKLYAGGNRRGPRRFRNDALANWLLDRQGRQEVSALDTANAQGSVDSGGMSTVAEDL